MKTPLGRFGSTVQFPGSPFLPISAEDLPMAESRLENLRWTKHREALRNHDLRGHRDCLQVRLRGDLGTASRCRLAPGAIKLHGRFTGRISDFTAGWARASQRQLSLIRDGYDKYCGEWPLRCLLALVSYALDTKPRVPVWCPGLFRRSNKAKARTLPQSVFSALLSLAAFRSLDPILSRVRDGFPLHVLRRIQSATCKRFLMVDNPAGTRARCSAS
jgi:hypothetical protein